MTITVTNAQRLGVHLWMLSDWAGSLDQLETMMELREQLRLQDFARVQPNAHGQVAWPAHLADETESSAELSPAAVAFVLLLYPPVRTPAALGPAKVGLLRKLRALAPETKEPDPG